MMMLAKLTAYRDWLIDHSRVERVLLFVLGVVLLLATGLAVPTLQATIGVLATQVVTWAVLLGVLYSWYALIRSVIRPPSGGAPEPAD